MSKKRLAIPFCAVVLLSALAAVLLLISSMFSVKPEAVADEGAGTIHAQPVLSQVTSAIVAEQMAETVRQNEVVVPARSLVEPGFIAVDGKPLDQAFAETLVESADAFTARIQHIDQKAVLPSGCELVALAVALQAEGGQVGPVDLVGHLHVGTSVAADYLGDPARNGGGLPPSIVDAANAWAASCGSGFRAVNLTGSSFEGVVALTKLGYPVLVWTTERLEEPRFTGVVDNGLQWYRPEHCVVVYGVEGDDVLVSDSLEGLVRRNLAQFSHIYEACGSKAVLAHKQ